MHGKHEAPVLRCVMAAAAAEASLPSALSRCSSCANLYLCMLGYLLNYKQVVGQQQSERALTRRWNLPDSGRVRLDQPVIIGRQTHSRLNDHLTRCVRDKRVFVRIQIDEWRENV